jgi:hypothetical protein
MNLTLNSEWSLDLLKYDVQVNNVKLKLYRQNIPIIKQSRA